MSRASKLLDELQETYNKFDPSVNLKKVPAFTRDGRLIEIDLSDNIYTLVAKPDKESRIKILVDGIDYLVDSKYINKYHGPSKVK